MMTKKLLGIFCITIICFMAFITPFIKATSFSYAETTNNFEPIRDQSDAVYAFQYYCKSRDLTIEGSIADAVTSFTTDAYNHTCNKIGVNPTELQAQLKAEYDQTGKPIKFLFSAAGVDVFNRLFSQFLQDNELQVGDTNVNKLVMSGSLFVDDNGNACYVFKTTNLTGNENDITEYGTVYRFNSNDLVSLYNGGTTNFNSYVNNVTYTFTLTKSDVGSGNSAYSNYAINNNTFYRSNGTFNRSMVVIAYRSNLYFGVCGKVNSSNYSLSNLMRIENKTVNDTQSANVYIIAPQINNNIYEGDTIINEEGDTIINNPDDPDDPDDPNYNPYPDDPENPTVNPPQTPSDPDDPNVITFPDIDIDLPSINWSLGDLSDKFPFSIPFDLIAFFTVLNAPAEAPAIDATIPLGDWYTWHFEADFSQFDRYAKIIRDVEFIAFCIGLIYLTIRLVKG